jgi:hypothetical protein
LHESIVDGIAGNGIEDYAAESARAGGGIRGRLLSGEARSKEERREEE